MNPYEIITRDGKKLDVITDQALDVVEHLLGYNPHSLTIVQGSYNQGGVAASAGTHDGGGAVDLTAQDWERKVVALRRVGFAAWHRPAIPGLWGEHVHAILMGNEKLSATAQAQVRAYLAGRNGLADNGPDTGPRQYTDVRFEMLPEPHPQVIAPPKPKRTLRHPIKGAPAPHGPSRRAIARAQLLTAQNAISRAMKELEL